MSWEGRGGWLCSTMKSEVFSTSERQVGSPTKAMSIGNRERFKWFAFVEQGITVISFYFLGVSWVWQHGRFLLSLENTWDLLHPFCPFCWWHSQAIEVQREMTFTTTAGASLRKLIVTYCPEYFFFLCWCHSLSWQDLGNIYLFNLKSHLLVSAAYNLGVLLNLEELIIPAGKGITSAAKLIVQQCLHLLHLRCFSFALHMDDDSLLEIGEFKGENLKHEITFLNREDTASE